MPVLGRARDLVAHVVAILIAADGRASRRHRGARRARGPATEHRRGGQPGGLAAT
jgi:hypothetical protein